ncbi:MAG: DegQ family serine endoprotease [Micavibrio sp.]|nr:MAG: DegQ family serine endoprotease [Micavibrio sp.]
MVSTKKYSFPFYLTAICFLFLLFAASVTAEARQVPESRTQINLSYAPVVKKTAPAVVNIYAERVVQQRGGFGFSPFFNDPLFQQFFGQDLFAPPMRRRLERSLGSGVIVSEDGLMISNAHVIKGAQEITAVMADGQEYQAEIVLLDERTDLAVLQIDSGGRELPYIELADSDEAEVGDLVLAIGNPFGVGQTVTSGIISAAARTAVGITDYSFFLQTDAAINPGNSGGALVGMHGRLLGINTAIFSRSGGSLGIGFAVPSNMVRAVIDAARGDGTIRRSWFGVSAQRLTGDIAQSLGLESVRGALITEVHPASPAGKAGLKTGDVVTHINGRPVEDPDALRFRTALVRIGDEILLNVVRRGRALQIRFTAVAPPENPPRETTELSGRHPLAGVVVANLSPAVAEEMGAARPRVESGVVVKNVAARSRIGLRVGDVIREINGNEIKSVRDAVSALGQPAPVWDMVILRGNQNIRMRVSG